VILFTARDREAAIRYSWLKLIAINEMDDKEFRELLQRSLQTGQPISDNRGTKKLLELHVNLSLTIMQAAIER
jgi:hypothetical protein